MSLTKCNAKLFGAVSTIAPKDDIRYFLNGVLIEPRPEGGVYLVASDGRRLIAGWDETGYAAESSIRPVIPEIVKACKHKQAESVLFDDHRMVVTVQDAEEVVWPSVISGVHLSEPIDGNFPDWKKVVDISGFTNAPIGAFNCDYMADIAKPMAFFPRESRCTQIHLRRDGASVIRFESIPNLTMLLMPMRAGDEMSIVPSWLIKSKKQEAE